MSERSYLVAKGLPRALKSLAVEARATGFMQPTTSVYSANRVNAHAAGRAAARDPEMADTGRQIKDMNSSIMDGFKRSPRVSDVHRVNQGVLRKKRLARNDRVNEEKVSRGAEEFLRAGGA